MIVTEPGARLVEVTRGGMVESCHRGHVAVIGPDGKLLATAGDPERIIYPRSAVKPFQAVGMVRAGLDLTDADLALAAASHSGEDFHVRGVLALLQRYDLREQDLQCPPDWPYDELVKEQTIRAGGEMRRATMNCSGKHAAMLRTCQINGWPTATYLDPDHPLQQHLKRTVEELTGESIGVTSTDGCGAPLWALSVAGLARGFSAVIGGGTGTAEARVADAMRAFPQYSGGTNRDVTALMRGVPGLLAKDGAEAVQAIALPDGRAIAVKIEDGSQRARPVVVARVLAALGVDAAVVSEQQAMAVLGGGRPVGEVAPSVDFDLRFVI